MKSLETVQNVNRATFDWDVEVTVLLLVMGRGASSPAHSVQMKNVTYHGAVHGKQRVLQKQASFQDTKPVDLIISLYKQPCDQDNINTTACKVLNTGGIQSCLTKEEILILCSCGVGLVFLTLAVAFACKYTCKKYISARENVNISASEDYQQPIHYQEVMESERLSADPASYRTLQQTVVNEQNNSFNRSINTEYSPEDRGDKYYYNVESERLAPADIVPIRVLHYKSAATDTDGYENPPFLDSTVNNEITPIMSVEKPYFKNNSDNDKGSVYLTVIHNSD
ncbi:uncharacterized protein LOC144618194 [Crassostrea virginica]